MTLEMDTMIELIINVITYVSLSILIIYGEPPILIKRFFGFKEEEYDTYGKMKQFFHRLIHCMMCISFWVTLILTYDIRLAIIVSAISMIVDDKVINR